MFTIAIFDLVDGAPASFSTYDLFVEAEKYKNYEPVYTDKVVNGKTKVWEWR